MLGEITTAVNGRMGDLTVLNPFTGQFHLAATCNWPDDVKEIAIKHFVISPAASAAMAAPLIAPLCSSRDLDIEAFHNRHYWQLCFADRGYYDYLVIGLMRNVSQVSSWAIVGGEERGPFEDEDLQLARLLSPHIRRAVGITDMLSYQRVTPPHAGTARSTSWWRNAPEGD